jgi:hypothetical protein
MEFSKNDVAMKLLIEEGKKAVPGMKVNPKEEQEVKVILLFLRDWNLELRENGTTENGEEIKMITSRLKEHWTAERRLTAEELTLSNLYAK